MRRAFRQGAPLAPPGGGGWAGVLVAGSLLPQGRRAGAAPASSVLGALCTPPPPTRPLEPFFEVQLCSRRGPGGARRVTRRAARSGPAAPWGVFLGAGGARGPGFVRSSFVRASFVRSSFLRSKDVRRRRARGRAVATRAAGGEPRRRPLSPRPAPPARPEAGPILPGCVTLLRPARPEPRQILPPLLLFSLPLTLLYSPPSTLLPGCVTLLPPARPEAGPSVQPASRRAPPPRAARRLGVSRDASALSILSYLYLFPRQAQPSAARSPPSPPRCRACAPRPELMAPRTPSHPAREIRLQERHRTQRERYGSKNAIAPSERDTPMYG